MKGAAGQGGSREIGEGLAWATVGAIILVLSIKMDRLSEQGVQAYAAPGLLPGLLGLFMIGSGVLLALRRRKSEEAAAPATRSSRTWIVIGLCLAFSLGVIGRGLPFWLASALFVAIAILVLNAGEVRGLPSLRRIGFAAAVGLASGVIATLIFQEIFLVRLP